MRRYKFVFAIALALLTTACAQPARVANMIAQPGAGIAPINPGSSLYGAFEVGDIYGGQATNPMWISQVGNAEFREALSTSLRAYGLTSGAPGEGRFAVLANLQSLDQPLFGASLTVTSSIQYKVTRKADNTPVTDETVVTPYTAAFGDSLLAAERLRLANEGAIRENISQFIQRSIQRMGGPAASAAPRPTS